MTKQTTQELQAILDGAPEGMGNYHQGFKQYYGGKNCLNLDNLREILELRKEVERLDVELTRYMLKYSTADNKLQKELRK